VTVSADGIMHAAVVMGRITTVALSSFRLSVRPSVCLSYGLQSLKQKSVEITEKHVIAAAEK